MEIGGPVERRVMNSGKETGWGHTHSFSLSGKNTYTSSACTWPQAYLTACPSTDTLVHIRHIPSTSRNRVPQTQPGILAKKTALTRPSEPGDPCTVLKIIIAEAV